MYQARGTKSILLLAGSFTFAFLLGELVHEYGHYLGHLAYGNPENVQVHIDPFGDTVIAGVTSLPDKVISVTSATGPLLNLLLAIACLIMLWHIRRPALLPILLWGPAAMIQEGVNLSLGMMTPGEDAQWIASIGVPRALLVLAGSFLLVVGIKIISLLLSLIALEREDPVRDKVLIIGAGMCSLMLVRFIHSYVGSTNSITENLVPLFFSLLLATIIVFTYKPLNKNIEGTKSRAITWSAALFSLALGTGMFLFQIAALN